MVQIKVPNQVLTLEGTGEIDMQLAYDSIVGYDFGYAPFYLLAIVETPASQIKYLNGRHNPPEGFFGYISYLFFDRSVVSKTTLRQGRQALPPMLLQTVYAYDNDLVSRIPEPDITLGGSLNGAVPSSLFCYCIEPGISVSLAVYIDF